MEEIIKALKTLPKEYLQVIILELMKDQKISYEDITQAYVEYLNMLRKGQSEAYFELQSKVVTMWSGTNHTPESKPSFTSFLGNISHAVALKHFLARGQISPIQ